ncbi:PGF-pre-PGF domain-containing protein [Haloferax sp. AB510]|uniref:PGF-pre-PGF domain-containing protein n=1 Tax=Haloferax sp. AB510 TaxID=2934172 RepID=UPI00209C1338|nr:PGF-pre-PGF domain-containing protein [Haloferax sp. AB510]MCO8265100.1 PGF-pre-PGF domain-containing protein [Haloferax sp. AB510]
MNTKQLLAVVMCTAMLVSTVAVGAAGAATAKTVSVDAVGSLDERSADSTATLTAYNVEDADGIGSYELNISYDDSVVDVSVAGNSRFNVETTDHGNGKLTVVGYTGETSGSTGNISLADLTVNAQSVGSDTSASIDVTVESITDTRGNLLSHSGDTTTVDVNNIDGSTPTPSTPTTDVPSSGGGGGGGGSVPNSGTYDSVRLFYGSQVSASLPDGATVTNVDVAFGSQGTGEVIVRERSSLPGTVGQPANPAVGFVQIDVPSSLKDSPSTVTMTVRQSRLDDLGITAQDLQVERYNDETGEWEVLDTRVVSQGDGQVVLEADTPGFSYFAVTSKQAVTTTTTADDGETTTADDGETTTGTSGFDDETTTGEPTTTDSVIPGFGVTAALIALVAIALIAVRRD